jgi:hypothetical protein
MRIVLALLFLATVAAAAAFPSTRQSDRILGKTALPPPTPGILVV